MSLTRKNHVGSGLRWAEAIAKEQIEANAVERASEREREVINQCDGCRQGAALNAFNAHVDAHGRVFMICQRDRYDAQLNSAAAMQPHGEGSLPL